MVHIESKLMNKIVLYIFGILMLLCFSNVLGQTYESKHFIIHSDMDSRYINIIQSNIETYYEKILSGYFAKGWEEPLTIYYSEKQSDTQLLLTGYGYKDKAYYGIYIGDMSAIFTHHLMDNGSLSGLGTLFHEIIHRFVDLNFDRPSTCFNEGLATFLGEQTRIVGNRLTLGNANPWREQILRDMIENGYQIDVKRLLSLSAGQFYGKRGNYHPTRALFYWLYENGHLESYLENVKMKGYALSVLEETVGKSHDQINKELLSFIKENCYPAAYFQDGLSAKDAGQKKKYFEEALSIKPSYQPAMLELARCYYKNKGHNECRNNLEPIITIPPSLKYGEAILLIADSYYSEKNYTEALQYYGKAWECLAYDEYKYEVAFWIASCHHFLGNREDAKQWYKVFLDTNWEPSRLHKLVDYAQSY